MTETNPVPAARLVIELGDANKNGRCDLSGSLSFGTLVIPLPAVDVDFLSVLPILTGAFQRVKSLFVKE